MPYFEFVYLNSLNTFTIMGDKHLSGTTTIHVLRILCSASCLSRALPESVFCQISKNSQIHMCMYFVHISQMT